MVGCVMLWVGDCVEVGVVIAMEWDVNGMVFFYNYLAMHHGMTPLSRGNNPLLRNGGNCMTNYSQAVVTESV